MRLDNVLAEGQAETGAASTGFVALFGGIEGFKDFADRIGGHAGARVANHDFSRFRALIFSHDDAQVAALGHGLAGVDDQVEEDLLYLRGVDFGDGVANDFHLTVNTVVEEVFFGEEENLADDWFEFGRFEAVALAAREGKHAGGDAASALTGGEDFVEGFGAGGVVLVAQAHPGVIDGGHQDVVELMRDRRGERADARKTLGLHQLVAQQGDLSFEFANAGLEGFRRIGAACELVLRHHP